MVAFATAGTFFLFALVSVVHFVFTYALVPETKGKTLEEVEQFLIKRAGGGVQEPLLSNYKHYDAEHDDASVLASIDHEVRRSVTSTQCLVCCTL